ncbi:zinc ribbon domain-containing protein [Pelotomaculum terephthalicicum JT]|uniref:FmdB family zinc ribbon protein n=1 Tax=Pelotomaculum TaxID=191373 RepID=UPI0009D3A7DD|nr:MULTISPECIES: zinc ribbon domain-containing protein [Pelotomaculum]MCG9968059.1 zinc ribbon domain-containing protein [Pelotomaculum terephthalicicum JT]OPX85642.1 MAG: Zinc ribbon domain protein [Pelotomaculum sp. PtaB.Bin117]OPY63986.1 MAG: Zinc ribbon domain protein [Pelotomaculum sp. PtaU1.Bin065]
MPIYEFRCTGCGSRFEKLCQLDESGEGLRCPSCGAASPKRVMSSFRAAGGGVNSGDAGCSTCGSSNCSTCGH